jgi:hypothetical protein
MWEGRFLPPAVNGNFMPRYGLDHEVEFWSGGIPMPSEYYNIPYIAPLNDRDELTFMAFALPNRESQTALTTRPLDPKG